MFWTSSPPKKKQGEQFPRFFLCLRPALHAAPTVKASATGAPDTLQGFHNLISGHVERRLFSMFSLFRQSRPDSGRLCACIARIASTQYHNRQLSVSVLDGPRKRHESKKNDPVFPPSRFQTRSPATSSLVFFLSNAFSLRCKSESKVESWSRFCIHTKIGTPNARLTRVSKLFME